MKIINGFNENIENIGLEVKNGKIVAFPTDTVYGLGAEVSNEDAIRRVYEVKNRPFDSPLIALIGEKSFINELCYVDNPKIDLLIDKFWPGALTIILEKKPWVSDLVSSGKNKLGVRMPDNEIAISLIKASGGALATPSANKSGQLSPTSAKHVRSQFLDNEIDYLIDGGKTKKAIESTILDMTSEPPMILRNGAVSKEEIEDIIGEVDEISSKKKSDNNFSKEIKIIKRTEFYKLQQSDLILAFTPFKDKDFDNIEILSSTGDYNEAVQNLFESLHRLIHLQGDVIYVEELEETGLGKLIMERVKKIAK